MANLSLRAAARRDIPQILPLIRRYWAFEGIEGFAAVRIEPLLSQLLAEPHLGAAWVAESGGRLVAYLIAVLVLSIEHRGLTAEIDEFFVLPEVRSQGVGAQLLALAEGALAARGCVHLQLQLGVTNEAARAFYAHRGYEAREGYALLDKVLSSGTGGVR